MTDLLIEALVAGILLGGVYGLIALGLNIIYGVLDIINFAHGAMMMTGMYLTFWLFQTFADRPLSQHPYHGPCLVHFRSSGLPLSARPDAWQGAAKSVSRDVGTVPSSHECGPGHLLSRLSHHSKTAYGQDVIQIGPAFIPVTRIFTFAVAVAATGLLLLIFQRTQLGRSIRAVAQQQDGAALCGIDVRHVYTLAFALGSACVGIAGAAVTPFFYISPTVGDVFNVASFVVVVLGGLGSMTGSLLGGLILGVTVSLGAAFLPGSFKEVLMFGIFLGVLLFPPDRLVRGAKYDDDDSGHSS